MRDWGSLGDRREQPQAILAGEGSLRYRRGRESRGYRRGRPHLEYEREPPSGAGGGVGFSEIPEGGTDAGIPEEEGAGIPEGVRVSP
jgi:hypothetical protein